MTSKGFKILRFQDLLFRNIAITFEGLKLISSVHSQALMMKKEIRTTLEKNTTFGNDHCTKNEVFD